MCKLLPRLGNDHKAPCLEKSCAVATGIEKEHRHTCKRKFGPKPAQEVKAHKPLLLSELEECSGRAGMHMAGGPV